MTEAEYENHATDAPTAEFEDPLEYLISQREPSTYRHRSEPEILLFCPVCGVFLGKPSQLFDWFREPISLTNIDGICPRCKNKLSEFDWVGKRREAPP